MADNMTLGATLEGVNRGYSQGILDATRQQYQEAAVKANDRADVANQRDDEAFARKEALKAHYTDYRPGQVNIDDLFVQPVASTTSQVPTSGIPVDPNAQVAVDPNAQVAPQPSGMPSEPPVAGQAPVPEQTPLSASMTSSNLLPEADIVSLAMQRKDEYNSWLDEARNLAMMAGGLEGVDELERKETNRMRQETFGYTSGAIMAMERGDTGMAAMLMNLANAHQSRELGFSWQDNGDGTLSTLNANGEVSGEPWDAMNLVKYQEENLATNENYIKMREANQSQRSTELADQQTLATVQEKLANAERLKAAGYSDIIAAEYKAEFGEFTDDKQTIMDIFEANMGEGVVEGIAARKNSQILALAMRMYNSGMVSSGAEAWDRASTQLGIVPE